MQKYQGDMQTSMESARTRATKSPRRRRRQRYRRWSRPWPSLLNLYHTAVLSRLPTRCALPHACSQSATAAIMVVAVFKDTNFSFVYTMQQPAAGSGYEGTIDSCEGLGTGIGHGDLTPFPRSCSGLLRQWRGARRGSSASSSASSACNRLA